MTSWQRESFDREIAEHRTRFEAGHFPALIEAVDLCATFRQPMADWMIRPIVDELSDHFNRRVSRGGRGKESPKGRYKRDLNDFMRWRALESAAQIKIAGRSSKTRIFDPRRSPKGGRPARGDAELREWALEAARNLLKSAGLPSTRAQIEAGWKRVQDAKDCGEAARYNFPRLTILPF